MLSKNGNPTNQNADRINDVYKLYLSRYESLATDIREGEKSVGEMEKYLYAALAAIYAWAFKSHPASATYSAGLLLLIPPALIAVFLGQLVRNRRKAFEKAEY